MNWLQDNWLWAVFLIAIFAMHMFGHGGHGGHGDRRDRGRHVHGGSDAGRPPSGDADDAADLSFSREREPRPGANVD